MKKYLHYGTSLLAMGLVAGLAPAAHAQSAAATPAPSANSLSLNEVVVTATARKVKKMKVSLSVTDVKPAAIEALAPNSQAELFRLIPGMIVNDTAGPSGNSNLSVRGLPITTGGSPFVQLQEDGLPTVLYGDMNFGNNDYWERYDASETIEAVRGGSVSTLASGAPGAVINYVSQDGSTKGGLLQLDEGVNFNQSQVNFAYGEPVSDTLRFHFDGFGRYGVGVRYAGWDAEKGYQFKGNVTQDFNDGQGWIRFNFKRLDDQEPNYTSYPDIANATGNITSVSPYPGFNSLTQSNLSIYDKSWDIVNNQGQIQQVQNQGIHPIATAIGAEVHYNLNDAITLDDNFRYTAMSGTFATTFMSAASTSSVLGSTVNGQTVGSIMYANGPNAGKAYNGAYLSEGPNIYVKMRDMGSIVNDFSANGKLDTGIGKFTAKAGVFFMQQDIAEDWAVNPVYMALQGKNAPLLNLYTGPNGTGNAITVMGQSGYGNNWGAGNARNYDLTSDDTAPYLDIGYDLNKLNLDASVRYDSTHVSGWDEGGIASTIVQDGVTLPVNIPAPTATENPNYTVGYTSWSFGALYAIDNDLSVFGRASRGGRVNVDRNILSGYINPDGSLNGPGKFNAVDIVYQDEIGAKLRGDLGTGYYGLNVTGFYNTFNANSYDLTAVTSTFNGFYQDDYTAKGVEIESNYSIGDFTINGNLTYTDAKIASSSTQPLAAGEMPAKTPAWVWLVAPTYSWNQVQVGGIVHGQNAELAGNPGTFYGAPATFVDAFVSYNVTKNLQVALHVNNLMNAIYAAQPDQGEGGVGASDGGALYTFPADSGRTITATLTAKF